MTRRASRFAWLPVTALGVAGCSGELGTSPDGSSNDANAGCDPYLEFSPTTPIAGPATEVRATAHVLDSPGVVDYSWTVAFQGVPIATKFEQLDHSAISFPAVTPGVYRVQLALDAVAYCPDEVVDLNVSAEGGNSSQVRLHVTPPASADVPPLDRLVSVTGGASFSLGNVILDPGTVATGQVRHGTTGVGAYLKFMPASGKEAVVESFSNPLTGAFSVRVLNQPHDVLVVPTTTSVAPQLIEDWAPGMALALVPGAAVTGTVLGPTGTPLVGATVRLTIAGVPSTLATTAASGGFSALAVPRSGAAIIVDVTPPAGSGLPRLTASSALLELAQPFRIAYAALALRDVGGATIRRTGTPIASARLTLVGNLGAAGTVTAGPASASATGSVRIAATANGSGVLPATLAPAKPLAAVVETSLNSYAVSAVDLTAGVPATIDAPPPLPIATRIRQPDLAGISGVFVEVVPVGALAMAGVSSARVTSGADGAIATSFAAGGHYELRFNDPAARGGSLIVSDLTGATIQNSYTLRAGLAVTGTLARPSGLPIGNASVQILCSLCAGLERDRPLAESASGPNGKFELVVPDPGTM